jgi:hypothetical protein
MSSIDLKGSSDTKLGAKESSHENAGKSEALTNFLIFIGLFLTLGVLIFAALAT